MLVLVLLPVCVHMVFRRGFAFRIGTVTAIAGLNRLGLLGRMMVIAFVITMMTGA